MYHIRGRGQRYGKYLGNQNFLLAFSKQELWSRKGKSSMFKRNKKINKRRFSHQIFRLEHSREN